MNFMKFRARCERLPCVLLASQCLSCRVTSQVEGVLMDCLCRNVGCCWVCGDAVVFGCGLLIFGRVGGCRPCVAAAGSSCVGAGCCWLVRSWCRDWGLSVSMLLQDRGRRLELSPPRFGRLHLCSALRGVLCELREEGVGGVEIGVCVRVVRRVRGGVR